MGIPGNSSKQSDEPGTKLNRLRSIKVTNLDRFRFSMRRSKSRLSQGIVLQHDSLDKPLQSKESPNYMKPTTCFNARKGSSQPNAGLKRMYSLKRMRRLPNQSSASRRDQDSTIEVALPKLKLIRSGSIKIARVRSIKLSRRRWSRSQLHQPSVFMTDDEELSSEDLMSDLLTIYTESTSSFNVTQKSMKSSASVAGIKPTRTLWKMPSLRSKRRPVNKFDRATCSSTLKSTKAAKPHHISGECETDSQLIGHVCPYTYCSLHGHLHAPSPPLKGFISTKRRLLKKQRSIRLKRRSTTEARDVLRMKQSMQVHEDPMSESQIDNASDTQGSNEEIFVQIYEPKPVKADELQKQSAETDILIDDKKYSNLWKLIYKHLPVPGTDGSNEEGETGKNTDANTTDTEGSNCNLNQDQQDENQNMNLDNQAVDKEKLEFSQTEAIEFIQRAVDEILHLDEQSPLYPVSPNTVLSPNDVGVCRDEEPPSDPAEEGPNGAILIKKEVSSERNQPRRQRSKGFEKLRKMIITAKFIKAIEKLRRINPQKPRYLSAAAKSQDEKILLRHLSIDGRKNTEEWMLDFALQQVIAKLAPHQRRRVTVLVEAFENINSDPSKLPPSNYMAPTTNVLEEERFIALDLNSSGLCDNAFVATVNAEDHIHPRVIDSGAKLVLEVDDKLSILQQVDETTEDEVLEKPMKANKEVVSSLQDPFQDSASDPTVNIHCEETNFSFDKEKFTNVWHNVYRQFIANEERMSGKQKVDGKEQEDGNASSYNECSDSSLGQIDVKDEVKQADAIQLVQEAIDELLLLHEQLSDQRPFKPDKKGHLCSLEPTDHSLILKDTQIRESEKTDTDDQKALPAQTSKPLSKLKKLVLSAKFIKTMEKLRKIRTCKTGNSSAQVSGRPVAEKVCLRHLSMDERRDSEEWMLDNALQQVISKLAPAQQRRVALLTQAFETITPEFEQVHTKYSRLKMQPDDYTTSSTKHKNEKDNLVVVDHDTPLIHDKNPQHSEDLIPEDASVVPAITIQTEGCPPSCPDNIQAEYKKDTGFKTKHHDEQTLIDSHEDEHKVNVQTYVLGERKYSKMWELIYQHVKSNSSAECENQTTEISASDDQSDDAAGKKLEITQSDAIKMVQEAVDGILQQCNSSEELSKNVSLDQNSPDGDYDVKGATVIPTEKNDQGRKPAQIAFRGNSKWKKAIICSKFVKAMEKMQKLYAQKKECHHNPLKSDQEAEVVHLRQSLMDERSNSEAWMLDYALRQVIAKLAPVQQQKVAMLIEAFETVGPDTEETSKESRCKMSNPGDIVFTTGSEGVKDEMSLESCQDLEPTGPSNIYNEKAEETKSSGESLQSQDIGKDSSNDGGNNIFLDGQKYSSMWRLIYKHVKSGLPNIDAVHISDADVEHIPTETDIYGPANDEETPCDSLQSSTDNENADLNLESTNTKLQQKDAIKLVEEAVNEILQMEVQSCDVNAIDSDEKTKEANKARQELPRSYSVLSKVILRKKFIKAMEKMKKSNPKDHRLLQQPDLPAESVHLRTQRMDEKNCEEWMLDYALQQVVGKLAPTQKKKVSMLVEAFERVNPLPDTRKHQRLNPVAR